MADSSSSPISYSSFECPTRIFSEELGGNCPVDVKCTSRDQKIAENRIEEIAPRYQGNGPFPNNNAVSTPLRLNGGGDTSFASQESINSDYQGNGIFENSITHSNSPHETLSFVNQDNSMSDQDIRDVLFEAGYTIEAIEDIITSKSGNLNKSLNSSETIESDPSRSEPGESAFDILRQIRVENVNRVMIGTLNINSLAS